MSPLQTVLAQVGESLDELGVGWALVGGLAVSARREPRFTRDVDLAVSVDDDADAERVVHALAQRGFDIETVIEQRRVERLATARIRSTDPHDRWVLVDLLFASSGIEPEIVAAADAIEVQTGMVVPVARVGHLIALKLLASDEDRPQDELDLHALLAEARDEDIQLAMEAASQIQTRGFHRNRDLVAILCRRRDH